jgi:hypothetical protein
MVTNERQTNSDDSEQDGDELSLLPGLSGALLMGLAALTKQLERYPRGARVLERLAYGGMICVLLVTWIRYGHG